MYFRLLKFLSTYIPALGLPGYTAFEASSDVVTLMTFTCFIFTGVGFFFNMLYGAQIWEYSSIARSLVTFARAVVGDVDFSVFDGTQWETTGPIILVFIVFMTAFVLLTMFVAIVDSSFSDAKDKSNTGKYTGPDMIWWKYLVTLKEMAGSWKGVWAIISGKKAKVMMTDENVDVEAVEGKGGEKPGKAELASRAKLMLSRKLMAPETVKDPVQVLEDRLEGVVKAVQQSAATLKEMQVQLVNLRRKPSALAK